MIGWDAFIVFVGGGVIGATTYLTTVIGQAKTRKDRVNWACTFALASGTMTLALYALVGLIKSA